MIDTSLFPYSTFPLRLSHKDSQKGTIICHFQCEEHLEKYLTRHNIDKKTCEILNANEQPTQPSKTNKNKMGSRTSKTDSGSSNSVRGRPKKLDSPRSSNKTVDS